MKNIYKLMMALVTAIVTLSACSVDNDPFTTADEFAEPRILNSDLTECKNGEPFGLPTISRDANFVYEVTVTPAEYTTVHWIIDGEDVFQGTEIDMPLLAGDHDIQILARTTQNKEAVRNCLLTVLPLEGDPSIKSGAKNLYCQTGTNKTIEGADLNNIVKVILGGKEAAATSNGSSVTFEVPEIADGQYHLTVVDADGMKYGCGKVTVSAEKWVDPSVTEVTLWEGSFDVTWGTPFNLLQDKSKELVADGTLAEGTVMRAYVEGEGQGCFASAWWRNLETGFSDDDAGRGDATISGDMVLEVTLNATSIDLINNQEGLFLVGDGYKVKKVTFLQVTGGKVLWEGEFEVTWGTPFNLLQQQTNALIEDGTLSVGKTICATVTGEGQGCIATAWWRNIITGFSDDDEGRGDTPISGNMVLEAPLSELSIQILTQQEGLFLVGNGYKVLKVEVK